MRKIVYAGGTFYTGDALAEAMLDYAAALARAETSATTFIPARTTEGTTGDLEILLGPASQLTSEPSPDISPEIVDEDALLRLLRLTAELAPPQPSFEPPFGDAGLTSTDDFA
jgi:hypothetical protein